jgi:hypothetical protein
MWTRVGLVILLRVGRGWRLGITGMSVEAGSDPCFRRVFGAFTRGVARLARFLGVPPCQTTSRPPSVDGTVECGLRTVIITLKMALSATPFVVPHLGGAARFLGGLARCGTRSDTVQPSTITAGSISVDWSVPEKGVPDVPDLCLISVSAGQEPFRACATPRAGPCHTCANPCHTFMPPSPGRAAEAAPDAARTPDTCDRSGPSVHVATRGPARRGDPARPPSFRGPPSSCVHLGAPRAA